MLKKEEEEKKKKKKKKKKKPQVEKQRKMKPKKAGTQVRLACPLSISAITASDALQIYSILDPPDGGIRAFKQGCWDGGASPGFAATAAPGERAARQKHKKDLIMEETAIAGTACSPTPPHAQSAVLPARGLAASRENALTPRSHRPQPRRPRDSSRATGVAGDCIPAALVSPCRLAQPRSESRAGGKVPPIRAKRGLRAASRGRPRGFNAQCRTPQHSQD